MRINKEYNLEEIIRELENEIEFTGQKNISINILTAQAIVDILKTIPENGSEGSKEGKAGCFGNYNEDEYELCEMCEMLEDCQEATKNGNLEKPHCFGEYTNNCELLYKKTPCEYIDECRVEKENRTGAENE